MEQLRFRCYLLFVMIVFEVNLAVNTSMRPFHIPDYFIILLVNC